MKKSVKITLIVISVILALIILLSGAFLILNKMGKLQFHKNDTDIKTVNVIENDEGILYKDQKYVLDDDVVSFLFIGVDKKSISDNFSVGLNGQADSLLVCAINTKTKAVSIIPISRETLVDVNQYSISGEYSGTNKKQVCLAYSYGKDVKQCSENVLLSVSRILYGINISSYITMDLDAFEKLSNAVGTIEVPINEDYTDTVTGIKYKAGQSAKVIGKSAVNYIHWRTSDVNANNYRMERQMSFLTAFMNKVSNSVSKDFSKVISYYNMMQPYVSTNISLSQTTYLATSVVRMNLGNAIQFKKIQGETFMLDGFSAFEPDADSLTNIIIETFYKKSS